MPVTFITAGASIAALLSGDLDHHSAGDMRSRIDRRIIKDRPSRLILDFTGVTFMDSSGIGLIMGRWKLMQERSGQVFVTGAPPYIRKVLKLAGVDRLAPLAADYEILLYKEVEQHEQEEAREGQ